MNPHKLSVEIYEMVQAGTDLGKVWQAYRGNEDVMRMFGNTIVNPKTEEMDVSLYRQALNKFSQPLFDQKAEADRVPFIAAQVALKYATLKLASDVIEAMHQVSPTNPRDVRQGFGCYQPLFQEPNEHRLSQAIDFLEQQGVDVAGQRARFAELFPAKDEAE